MDVDDRNLTDPDILSKITGGYQNTTMARSRRTNLAGFCRETKKSTRTATISIMAAGPHTAPIQPTAV